MEGTPIVFLFSVHQYMGNQFTGAHLYFSNPNKGTILVHRHVI